MNASDLRIEAVETYPSGGQQVGRVETKVKVTHIPTGLIAVCGLHRSMVTNRDVAIEMIEWGLAS